MPNVIRAALPRSVHESRGTLLNIAFTLYNTHTYQPPRISRAIQGNGPVENVSLPDIECGGDSAHGIVGSTPAPLHAPAEAGSTVNLRWTLWPESHQGPIITYMARCPDTGEKNYSHFGPIA